MSFRMMYACCLQQFTTFLQYAKSALPYGMARHRSTALDMTFRGEVTLRVVYAIPTPYSSVLENLGKFPEGGPPTLMLITQTAL